mgnify:FL=1
MPKAEYRSSIRSKNLIKKAVAKLIREKEISKITVSDVIREADISRGTFYAHFADVSGVIDQIESEELKNLMDFVDHFGVENIGSKPDVFVKIICEYLSKDIEYYRMLTQSNILNNFIFRLINIYYEKTLDMILAKSSSNKDEANLYLIYITSGAKEAILNFIKSKVKGTPEEIGSTVGKLVKLTQQYYTKD